MNFKERAEFSTQLLTTKKKKKKNSSCKQLITLKRIQLFYRKFFLIVFLLLSRLLCIRIVLTIDCFYCVPSKNKYSRKVIVAVGDHFNDTLRHNAIANGKRNQSSIGVQRAEHI